MRAAARPGDLRTASPPFPSRLPISTQDDLSFLNPAIGRSDPVSKRSARWTRSCGPIRPAGPGSRPTASIAPSSSPDDRHGRLAGLGATHHSNALPGKPRSISRAFQIAARSFRPVSS